MSRYNNLKEYIQKEHFKLLESGISNHLGNTSAVKEIKVIQLYIPGMYVTPAVQFTADTDYESKFHTDIVLLVSASIDRTRYFEISLSGNLIHNLNDLTTDSIREVSANEKLPESLPNSFFIYDIPETLQDSYALMLRGNSYISHTDFLNNPHPKNYIDYIPESTKLSVYYAELPEDCFGRIYFRSSDEEIISLDPVCNELRVTNHNINPCTILLNRNKFLNTNDDSAILTICHELVHWNYHQKFFKLLEILGTDSYSMSCKDTLIPYREHMTDVEKALCIAEHQAEDLAFRIAIPKEYIQLSESVYYSENTKGTSSKSEKLESMISAFAENYGVSKSDIKRRMIQLGRTDIDGTCIKINDKSYPSFTYTIKLKPNQTFLISTTEYNRLYRVNEQFSDLINSGEYIYNGYVICKFKAEYLTPVINDDKVSFLLSDYAREHAEECCLVFDMIPIFSDDLPENILRFLCRNENVELTPSEIELIKNYKEKIKLNQKLFFEIQNLSFTDALNILMKVKKITIEALAEKMNVSDKTVKNYKKLQGVNLKVVVKICLSLNLPSEISYAILQKAGMTLQEKTKENNAYKFLLELMDDSKYHDKEPAFFNAVLAEFDIPCLFN